MTAVDGPGGPGPDGSHSDRADAIPGAAQTGDPDLAPVGGGPELAAARARRELAVVVVLAVAGGALALYASSRTWTVTETPRPSPLPAVRDEVTGRESVPWAAAMSFVALAGGLALLAVRRVGRAVVGGLLVLTGLVVVSGGLTGGLTTGSSFQSIRTNPAWPAVFIVGGIAILIGGSIALLRGGQWTAIGARYDRDRGPTEAGTWDALDRGEDPTH